MAVYENHPLVNFRFEVTLDPPGGEFYFSKVTGIEKSLTVETITEGGNNNYPHHLPGKTEYTDLVLHRGVLPSSSTFLTWCEDSIAGNFDVKIVPKTVIVKLLDEAGVSMISWHFKNAFPIRLKVGDLDAQSQAILIEEISLKYSEFERTYP
ncbi:MAG: phage tail protein [Salibacteraceae bacterium]|jgi:phage tail-like protein|nr:phage tail protein [Salibacteraceae bacterium]MDP4686059.1 phage tail protein [Salibacteraceae bacterium]MDP4764682.1 phage tail protein [Salibacteraceae bacterium]MDP4843985.1 phage tail protein [Salibacteraceae bacterium]MDP4964239.1 phage tail protein [Salibacteraceae bacterium]